MQTSTLETTLSGLRKDLEDVKTRINQPGSVYMAYKEHTLSAGICALENLKTADQPRYSESISALLGQYRQTYKTIFNH